MMIPLDVILDTHMGTVYRLSPRAVTTLKNKNYHKREYNHPWDYTDDFSRNEFIKAWDARDVDTLKVSILTRILETVKVSILRKEINNLTIGGDCNVSVKINIHPYILKQIECNELKKIIYNKLDKVNAINIVSIPNDELTPDRLRAEETTTFILADLEPWIVKHYVNLAKTPSPNLECIVPMFAEDYSNRIQNAVRAGKIDGDMANNISPFHALEVCLSPLIKLSFLPVELFSFPVPGSGKK